MGRPLIGTDHLTAGRPEDCAERDQVPDLARLLTKNHRHRRLEVRLVGPEHRHGRHVVRGKARDELPAKSPRVRRIGDHDDAKRSMWIDLPGLQQLFLARTFRLARDQPRVQEGRIGRR